MFSTQIFLLLIGEFDYLSASTAILSIYVVIFLFYMVVQEIAVRTLKALHVYEFNKFKRSDRLHLAIQVIKAFTFISFWSMEVMIQYQDTDEYDTSLSHALEKKVWA